MSLTSFGSYFEDWLGLDMCQQIVITRLGDDLDNAQR